MDKTVIVNGRPKTTSYERLSHADVVSMALDKCSRRLFSVTYRSVAEDGSIRQGTLAPGDSVTVVEGMVFNAYVTDNA